LLEQRIRGNTDHFAKDKLERETKKLVDSFVRLIEANFQ